MGDDAAQRAATHSGSLFIVMVLASLAAVPLFLKRDLYTAAESAR